MESMRTETAGLCCEECVTRQECLWSIWEASGEYLGSCYLVLINDNNNIPTISADEKKDAEEKKTVDREETEAGVCRSQEQRGTFGYNGKNGEVRYVISNGLCGVLSLSLIHI